MEKRYIIAKRPNATVFRIDPPLIIEKKTLDDFVHTFEHVMLGIQSLF